MGPLHEQATVMRRLLSRWPISLLGAALLAGLVWVFGPLWPPLEPVLPRVIAVQTLLVAWAVLNALLDWRRRARDAALTAGLSEAGEESAAVGQTLAKALASMRQSAGRAALAELPWYALIGPPGAGKTTALLNAGLQFTVQDATGRAAVAGVGGTRLCEWWFTKNAVLIDTAGRYTTQDSDAAVDRAGWNAFLALLKRTRPSQPLNGVIVAIGLPEVVQADASERDAHAAAIARRIAELEERFGLRLPVYALFTKADLVAGFTEFFDDLDADGRSQVWGQTFPLNATTPGVAERFQAGFRALSGRLSARMLPRLGAEHRLERRAAIAGFPTQFASLEKPLAGFVGAAFAGTAMLRGVYFTSGTQEGTPMDRLTGAMARAFGLPASRPAALRPEAGRSYFLERLVRDVILGEAMLVRQPPGRVRRRKAVRAAGFALVLLALAGTAGAVVWSAREGEVQIDAVATAVSGYEQDAGLLAAATVSDDDLRPLAAALDRARALSDAVPPEPVGFGLSQSAKLDAGARAVYRAGLENGLLPRIVWRLETEMRGMLTQPDLLYEITRVYLMLGGAGPLDPAQVHSWIERDWTRTYPDPEDAALVATLLGHLDRLLAEPLPPVALDGPLVAAARASFRQVPAAQRAYANIRSSAAAAALPAWRPFDLLGLAGATVFTRASGKPMTDGIPGLFTAQGFRTVLRPALPLASRQVAAETWVVGRSSEFAPAELQQLEQDVSALFLAEFTARWDTMLADLNIAPIASLPQAAQVLYILASPESPMRALLRSAALQVQLPGREAATASYAGLVGLIAGDGAPLERSLRLITDIQQQFAKIAALPVGTPLPAGGEEIGTALQADAARQPQPVSRWLSTIASAAQALRTGNARRQVALIFGAPGGPAQACAAAVTQYPFAAGGAPLPLEEFARVFGPAGVLDGFLNTQLKPYVDVSSKPWKPLPSAPVGQADVAQFQRAAAIRDAFFPGGQAAPSFPVEVTPAALPRTPGPAASVLTIGGTVIEAGKGPPRATQLAWPPPGIAVPEVSLVADTPPLLLREAGPWALHRLLARGRTQPSPKPGHQLVVFGAPPAAVAYDIAAAAFAPGLFSEFRCPAVQ